MAKAVSAAFGRNNRTFLTAMNISQTTGLGGGVMAGTRKPWEQVFTSKHSHSKRCPSGRRIIIEWFEPSAPAVIKPPGGTASPSRSVSELPLRCQSPCLSQTIPVGSEPGATLSATTMVTDLAARTRIPASIANNKLLRFMLESNLNLVPHVGQANRAGLSSATRVLFNLRNASFNLFGNDT